MSNGAAPRAPRSGQRDALDAVWSDMIRGSAQRWVPGQAVAKLSAGLAGHPRALVTRSLGLAGELAKVAVGRSELQPDRRFKDPAWKANPAFRRLVQAYIAVGESADGLLEDVELDWRTERRVRFAVENLLDALAPTNFPLLNPTVIKAIVDSGGLHFLQGARNLAQDLRRRPFLPSSVDSSKFEVGDDLAVTPGVVVLRTEAFELIQYDPQTENVHETPLVLVPQMINKYYIADLAPGRSMLEWAVTQGQQVFAISWRNPDGRQADWDFDTYVGAVLEALDAVVVVFARTGESGPEGISVFVVPGDADGFRTEPLETMGLSGWKLGELHFEDVEVPHENLLGAEDGTGFKAAMQCFDFSRPCVATQAVGVAQGAVDLALDYATRRQVFDQPLAAHQGVQMKLAAMEAEILTARALAYQASAMVDEGHPRTTKFSSAAKLVASEVAMRATTQAVDVLGGNGYLRGFPAERMMRDAKVLQIYEGANDIQRLVLAREMAGEAESREAVWPEWMPGAPGVASGEGPEAREHAPA